jgi:putative PIN family toxin of toxin-antitoxin system
MPDPRPLVIVLDTNVLVSALLKRASKPGLILDLVLDGKIRLALDARVLQEYQDVCVRPKFGIRQSDATAVLAYLQVKGLRVDAAGSLLDMPQLTDPGDQPFAEVAVAAQVDALVTGNIRHFGELERVGVSVQTPAQFLEFHASLTYGRK